MVDVIGKYSWIGYLIKVDMLDLMKDLWTVNWNEVGIVVDIVYG